MAQRPKERSKGLSHHGFLEPEQRTFEKQEDWRPSLVAKEGHCNCEELAGKGPVSFLSTWQHRLKGNLHSQLRS